MDWTEGIKRALDYIEKNITEDISAKDVANEACVSTFYFQKAFSLLCGYSLGEYIRLRRLTLAGSEVAAGNDKIIDIALKYGFDSPDSFTKAFTRFHKITPSAIRKNDAPLKMFAPLKIELSLKGGYIMDYKIVQKEALTFIGMKRTFDSETSLQEIPKFWNQYFSMGMEKKVCPVYAICLDEAKEANKFDYMIGNEYNQSDNIPDGFITKTIPAYTWAVFVSIGKMPEALQEVTKKVFSEFLPNSTQYELAGDYSIEYYTDVNDYPKKNQDEAYRSEVWIPVKRK